MNHLYLMIIHIRNVHINKKALSSIRWNSYRICLFRISKMYIIIYLSFDLKRKRLSKFGFILTIGQTTPSICIYMDFFSSQHVTAKDPKLIHAF